MIRAVHPPRKLHKLTSICPFSVPFLTHFFSAAPQLEIQLDLNPVHYTFATQLSISNQKQSNSADTRQLFDELLLQGLHNTSTASLLTKEHNPTPELGVNPDPNIYAQLLRSCLIQGNSVQFQCSFRERRKTKFEALEKGKVLHNHILKFGFPLCGNLGNALVDLYAKCGELDLALRAFQQLVERDELAWNSILFVHSTVGLLEEAVHIFWSMRSVNARPNQYTFAMVLSACARLNALGFGKQVHCNAIKMGFESNSFCEGSLVDMYAKCNSVADARRVFDSVGCPDTISWTVMIAGYVRIGLPQEALELFLKMRRLGGEPDQVLFVTAITACVNLGRFKDAFGLFAEIPILSVVAWNVMISGLAQNGYEVEALSFFKEMHSLGTKPTRSTLGTVFSAIANVIAIDLGQQVHSEAHKLGLDTNVFVGSSLISMYAKCSMINYARKIFDMLDEKNIVLWNAMLGGYSKNAHHDEVLTLFLDMRTQNILSDEFTYVSILTACAPLDCLDLGRQIHSSIIKNNLQESLFAGNAIVDMYAKSGDLKDARQQFELIRNKDNVSWNSILVGYANNEDGAEALITFQRMVLDNVAPDEVSLATVLSACANLQAFEQGHQVHCLSIKHGLDLNLYVGSSLIDMYAKCGSIEAANKAFFEMSEKSVVSWNALISGYIQNNNVTKALELFQQMQIEGMKPSQFTFASILPACDGTNGLKVGMQAHCYTIKSGHFYVDSFVGISLLGIYLRSLNIDDANRLFWEMPNNNNIVSWTAIISGLAHINYSEEALQLFWEMRDFGARPDQATFVSILKASADLTALMEGREVHSLIIHTGFNSDVHTVIALIDMYSKCGDVRSSFQVFNEMDTKQDVTLWNSMIVGFSKNGYGEDALRLFNLMQQVHIRPDDVTILGVLTACSHAGLISQGLEFFNSIQKKFGFQPRVDHYACMIDLLGRGGYLKEAEEFIDELPFKPDAIIWATLLAACRIHKDDIRGQQAAEKLIELEPQSSSPYVLLSNIYAASGNWDGVNMVRKAMRDKGARKLPGCSWIVLNKKTNLFVAGDKFHPSLSDIYALLKDLTVLLKENGYVASLDLVLHDED